MKKVITIVLIIIFVTVAAILYFNRIEPKIAKVEPFVMPAMSSEVYTNEKYNFSAGLPEGFKVRESIDVSTEGDLIIFENEKGEGIQILVTPIEDMKVLTVDMIKTDLPELKISEAQVLEIGEDYRGLAFKSDNKAFDGASREVWFVFRGNLYQISTYERLDELLKAIFSTWQFKLN